jgi:hypothetical protein
MITVKDFIEILEKMPQDHPIAIECLFGHSAECILCDLNEVFESADNEVVIQVIH